ncbi:MAG: dihydroxy-acid dehydratase [Gemmatimonadetes bacterium]|nr:dihydroxy-acid dehydratase [Gemmatimonadota bacterium]|tara:strand:- start:1125 stop:2903 length:1779 start_codon:yes stop_codon:yes gene_type:complete
MAEQTPKELRSQEWFNNPDNPGMTAVYVERYMNYGITREELQDGRPIIGIAQTGNDLAPCNRHHIFLAQRVKEGIRDAGGFPFEFPVHPIAEQGKRPTAALDRNLAYMGIVEVLHGYPLDGVVLTTGCDKTTPACLMAAATMDIPSIVLSGGPMLDGHWEGMLAGSGTVIWEAREAYAAEKIDYEGFMDMAVSSSPSVGHCNTMGTALSMNSLTEALGMSLTGCAAIPGAYRERAQMAYHTGKRIVEMVREDLCPSQILTREAFLNAIVVNSAIGGSTNAPPHLVAIARHIGAELSIDDFQTHGHEIPLIVNCQPAGEWLGEAFYRAGGIPAVMGELKKAGKLDESCLTVTGKTMGENLEGPSIKDPRVIKTYDDPMKENAGFIILSGNLFDSGLIKTSVIGDEFRKKYLEREGDENAWEGKAIVFEGPEDYHDRINDPELEIDDQCILFVRGCGPVGFPGSAEVVNMLPPDHLVRAGVPELPCVGDGRQSGTSASPSILNCSPEAAVGGNLSILQTGDTVRIDLNTREVNVLIDEEEIEQRRGALELKVLDNQTPWEEIYRSTVSQLADGAVMKPAVKYQKVKRTIPRHSH